MAEVIECSSCSMCHKQAGLPILLTRYAIAAKATTTTTALYGEHDKSAAPPILDNNDAPPLAGDFKTQITDKKKQPVALGDGTQYTLRLLRPGYVYVYNPKDPDGLRWRGYVVTDDQYLQEFQVTDKKLKFKAEGLKEKKAPCKPDKNEMMGRCITIPGANKAGTIWIGFSDTRWTDKQLRANEADSTLRDRHMRQIDIAAYLKTKKHEHTVCIHSLPKESDGWVRPIVAEYAYPIPEKIEFTYPRHRASLFDIGKARPVEYEKQALKDAPCDFEFSASPFQRLGSTFVPASGKSSDFTEQEALRQEQERLNKKAKNPVSLSTLGDEPSDSSNSALLKKDPALNKLELGSVTWIDQSPAQPVLGSSPLPAMDFAASSAATRQKIKSELNAFTHLVREFDRFYARIDEPGKNKPGENSEQFRGDGMILALDDPAGLAMDLAGMIEARWHAFKTQKQYYRPLMTIECLAMARTTIPEKAKEAVNKRKMGAALVIAPQTRMPGGPSTKEAEEEIKLIDKYPKEILESECMALAQHYDNLIYPDKITDFLKKDGDYALKAITFGEKVIDPLARAHTALFQSPELGDIFICNFDSSEGVVDDKGKVSSRDPGYREHGGPYLTLLEQCLGATGSNPICEPTYRAMLSGENGWKLDEKNLLWMGVNLNRMHLANEVKRALKDIAAIEDGARTLTEQHKEALDGFFNNTAPGVAIGLARIQNNPQAAPTPEEESVLENIIDFVRKWGWAWWDAFCTATFTAMDIFGDDPAASVKLRTEIKTATRALKDIDADIKAAHKVYEKAKAWRIAEEAKHKIDQNKLAKAQGTTTTTRQAVATAQVEHDTAHAAWQKADAASTSDRSTLNDLIRQRKEAVARQPAQSAIDDAEAAMKRADTARSEAQIKSDELATKIRNNPALDASALDNLRSLQQELRNADARGQLKIQNLHVELEAARRAELHATRISEAITNKANAAAQELGKIAEGMHKSNRISLRNRFLAHFNESLLRLAEKEVRGGLDPRLSPSNHAHHLVFSMAVQEGAPITGLHIKSVSPKAAQRQMGRFFELSPKAVKEFAPLFDPQKTAVDVTLRQAGNIVEIIETMPRSVDVGTAISHAKAIAGQLSVSAEHMPFMTPRIWRWSTKNYQAHHKAFFYKYQRERREAQLSDEERAALDRQKQGQALQEKIDELERNKVVLEEDLKRQAEQEKIANEETAKYEQEKADLAKLKDQSAATQAQIKDLDERMETTRQSLAKNNAERVETKATWQENETKLKVAKANDAKAAGTQGKLETQVKANQVAHTTNLTAENNALARIEHLQTEEARVLEYGTLKGQLIGGGVLATFNAVLAGAVLISWTHEFDKYKEMTKDKNTLTQLKKTDPAYVKSMSMYMAAVANFAAGVSDLIQVAVEVGAVVKNWGWALRIGRVMRSPYYVWLGRGASSVLSFVGAVWDTVEAIDYGVSGQIGWAGVYALSAGLGIAAGFVVLFGVAFSPVGIGILVMYASYVTALSIVVPDKLELWMKNCYFGRERKTDSLSYHDWADEIRSFRAITGKRVDAKSGQ